MKVFTLDEANSFIPQVRPLLEGMAAAHAEVVAFREQARAASAGADCGGGGVAGASNYVGGLCRLGEMSARINDMGIQIKDYSRGLIDFPCLRDGRVVLLCWQLGDEDEITWWHEIEGGFAGRQPL
jgi:hypothetical protein